MKKLVMSLGLFFLAFTLFSQNLQVVEGKVYSDSKLYTGYEVSYFENTTQVKATKHYVNGLEDGKSIMYHPNGAVKAERYWKEGQKDGLWVNYDENGNKLAEAGYQADKKHGPWNIWNATGQKLFEMHYNQGVKVGIWRQ